MSGTATVRGVALFGKRDAGGDYEWLRGRDAIPDGLFETCEQLARTSNETGSVLSLLAALDAGPLLLRTYRQGADSAHRPVIALEVATVESELAPEDWLGLAWSALQPTALESAGGGNPVSLELPAPSDPEGPIDAELLDKVLLGVPVSVGLPVARGLLRRSSSRFRGVAYTPKLKSGSLMPWNPALAPFLAVNFAPAALRPEDEAALRDLAARRPSPEERQRLEPVEAGRVRRALHWALHPDGTRLLDSADDPLLPWLVSFRRARAKGIELLRALREDLSGGALPAAVMESAFPELSAAAREAVVAASRGDGSANDSNDDKVSVLEELAQEGFLGAGDLFPLRSWATMARGSQALARAALAVLRERGATEGAARLALQLPAGEPAWGKLPTADEIAGAADTARQLGLPAPLDALRALLARISTPRDLESLQGIGDKLGDEGASLIGLARLGTLPTERTLTPSDIVLALEARLRASSSSADLMRSLAELLQRGWDDEARAVLAAEAAGRLPLLSPLARVAVRRRLDGGPLLSAGAAELRPLAWAGLARPEDVAPPGAVEPFAVVAELWPQTAPLAGALRGSGPVPPPSTLPPAWHAALREVLTAGRAEVWLARLQPSERPAARAWLCAALALPAPLSRLFGGEPLRPSDGPPLLAHLQWVVALAGAEELAERLGVLVGLAHAGLAADDDRLAAQLVEEVLPSGNDLHMLTVRALAVHALSGVGPLPPVAALAPDILRLMLPVLAPIPVVDALFTSLNPASTDSPMLREAVFLRVREAGAACPAYRYTAAQLELHAELACRLAELDGWGPVVLEPEARRRAAQRRARSLGLSLPEFGNPLAEETAVEEGEAGGASGGEASDE